MKRITGLILVLIIISALCGCSSSTNTVPSVSATVDASSENITEAQDEPPFFEKSYDINGNFLELMAGYSSDELTVSIFCNLDGSAGTRSGILYVWILSESLKIAKNASTVILIAGDTSTEESGHVVFYDGSIYMKEDPPYYDEDYDYTNDESFIDSLADYESVITAFNELSEACGFEAEEYTEAPTEAPTEKPVAIYYADQYKVGVDIPAGIYVAYPTDDWGGYYCISSDANSHDIIANDGFDGQTYFEVANGQYLELRRCVSVAVKDKIKVDTSSGIVTEGQYLVGEDIPAGEYKLSSTDSYGGYYCISSDPNGRDIIANNGFDNSNYVTISDGQYLKLSRCELILK